MLEAQLQIKSLRGWRAEVGLLAPGPGMFREWDMIAPEGVRFSAALLGFEGHTVEVLKGMADAVEIEAKKLNHTYKCDLICFACTSGSFIGGPGYDRMLIEKIEKVSGSPATTTTTCVLEIFKDIGIKKIALVGPYPDSTLQEEINFFAEYGVETLYWKGLGLVNAIDYWDFSKDPYSCYRLVREAARAAPDADCIFATCMASPILGVADYLEEEIGKPLISSLSATLYGILKMLGIPDPVYHYGKALAKSRVK